VEIRLKMLMDIPIINSQQQAQQHLQHKIK
jgi:hypothetical protein